MAEWKDYPASAAGAPHTVAGSIRLLERLHSPQLGNSRHILVYLPPSYATSLRRYPVIYMHDGQNLFDAGTSFAGEWEVDQTLEAASEDGLETIVVGIPNMGADRVHEYTPFRDPQRGGGGLGETYLRFIIDTLKPLVDADFRTRTGREHTGIAGSSLGALISLYAFFRHRDVFGFAGVMSPALWFGGGAILPWVASQPFVGGRIYIDVGLREGQRVVADLKRLRDMLQAKGYRNLHDLLCVIDTAGDHSERAWGRRLRRTLHFLLDVPRLRSVSG